MAGSRFTLRGQQLEVKARANVAMVGLGATATIDGEGLSRLFYVAELAVLRLQNIMLTGGARLLRAQRVTFLIMEWDGGGSATARGYDWREAVRPLREQGLAAFSGPTGAPFDFQPTATPIPTSTVFWQQP